MMDQTRTLLLPRRTPPQKRISQSSKRFDIAAWGRQSGKTTHGIHTMATRPLQGRKGGVYWFVLQTFDAATIAFERLSEFAKPTIVDRNKVQLRIQLENG